MHDCGYVNTPFLKCIIYEATGGKWNSLLCMIIHPTKLFFFKLNPKVFFKCSANTVITLIMHLTKILFPP